jgi:hypothetical protein
MSTHDALTAARAHMKPVLIEVDFEADTISRFGLPATHRHA